jgi:hypothetical protein
MIIAHEIWEDFIVEVETERETATITVQISDGPTGPEAFTIQGDIAMVHRLLHSMTSDLDSQIGEMVKSGELQTTWRDEDNARAERQRQEDEDG